MKAEVDVLLERVRDQKGVVIVRGTRTSFASFFSLTYFVSEMLFGGST